MSYDIELIDATTKKVIKLDKPTILLGGTYCPSGTNELSCNITYNYSDIFRKFLGKDGIRSLYGKIAGETLPKLIEITNNLNDDVSNNYWDATEGNAKESILTLIRMATLAPFGIWQGD